MSDKEDSSEPPSESSMSSSSISSGSSSPSSEKVASSKKVAAKKGGGGDGKNKRKRVDPNAPKKPLTSYMLYMQAQRASVMAANPALKFGEVSKKISEDWKVLTEAQKKVYTDKAADDKKRFEAEMKNYKPPVWSDDESENRPKKKAKKDPDAPKRGQNAYMFFANELREKMKGDTAPMKAPDFAKFAGEKWRTMTADEKKPYDEKAAADKERAERETAAYKRGEKPPPKAAPVAAAKTAAPAPVAAASEAKKEADEDDDDDNDDDDDDEDDDEMVQ